MISSITAQFVDNVPDNTVDGIVYVSIRYCLAIHRCCCGCGREVTTKLNPSRWALSFDGDTISLSPSIGNWDFPCRSHYWIRRNQVRWARSFSDEEIEEVRQYDLADEAAYLHGQLETRERAVLPSERRAHFSLVAALRRLRRGGGDR